MDGPGDAVEGGVDALEQEKRSECECKCECEAGRARSEACAKRSEQATV